MGFLGRASAGATFLLAHGVAPLATAQTVDDVVRRYVEARGGAANLRAVESLRFTGTMELPDVQASFVLELKRPNPFAPSSSCRARRVSAPSTGSTPGSSCRCRAKRRG